jgi:hypothetical protein
VSLLSPCFLFLCYSVAAVAADDAADADAADAAYKVMKVSECCGVLLIIEALNYRATTALQIKER